MITVNLPTPTQAQGGSTKNMFAQCLSPLSMPDGATSDTSAAVAVATAVAPASHLHPQHECSTTTTASPPPSKKSNKAVTFHVDTVYHHNPSCSSNNEHNTPTTPLHQAAESITKFFSLDNMEQMLNCVPLNVDVLSPTSRRQGGKHQGSGKGGDSKKSSSSESSAAESPSGVQQTIGSIFFNKFTPQEVTEFSFMAEREAVMNGDGDTSFDFNDDDHNDTEHVEHTANHNHPSHPSSSSEQSLLQMVQHTAWNIHGTSELCAGTSAAVVAAVLDIEKDGDDTDIDNPTLVCGAPVLALSPNNNKGIPTDNAAASSLHPTDNAIVDTVNTATTSKVCSIVDTITATNKEEDNFGVAGGLWSLPSHDVSHDDDEEEGDDDDDDDDGDGSMSRIGTSFVSAATSGTASIDVDENDVALLYHEEETVQHEQQQHQQDEKHQEAATIRMTMATVDQVMMMRSPTSVTTAASNQDDEQANPILAAQRAISHAMLSPVTNTNTNTNTNNNPPPKSSGNDNENIPHDKYWSTNNEGGSLFNSGSEEYYSDTLTHLNNGQEEEEEEGGTYDEQHRIHYNEADENEEDVEAMIEEMLETEGAAMETFGGAATVPESHHHPSSTVSVPPYTQMEAAPIAEYHPPHHQYATDEEANAHFDQMMSAFELSLNRPQLSTTMDERHAYGMATSPVVSPTTRSDTNTALLSSGAINATFGTAFNFDHVDSDENNADGNNATTMTTTPSAQTTSGNTTTTTSRYQRRPLPHQPFSPLAAAAAARLGDKKKRQQQQHQQQPLPLSTSVVSFLEDSVMGRKLNRNTPPSSPVVSTMKKALVLPSSNNQEVVVGDNTETDVEEVSDGSVNNVDVDNDNVSIVSHGSLLDRASQSVVQAKQQNTQAHDSDSSAYDVGKSVAEMVASIHTVIQDSSASTVAGDNGEVVEEEEEEHDMSQEAEKNASVEDVDPTSACPEDEPQTYDDDEVKLRAHQTTTPKSKRLQRLKPISRLRFAKAQVMEQRKVSDDESSCPDDEKMMKRTGQQHQEAIDNEVFDDDAPEDEKMNFLHQQQLLQRPRETVESSIADTTTGTGNSFDSSVNWDTLAYSMSVETTALSTTRGDREDSSSVMKDNRALPFLPPVTPSTARADILEEEEKSFYEDNYYEPTTPSAARVGILRDSVGSVKEARIPLKQRVEYFDTNDDLPSTPISAARDSKKARIKARLATSPSSAQARAHSTPEPQQSANQSPVAWERIERIKQQHDERIGNIRSMANSPKTFATQLDEDESLPLSPTVMMSQMKTRIESIKKRHEVSVFQGEEAHQPSKSGYGSKLSVTTSDEENVMPLLSPNTMRTQSLKLRLQAMKKQHEQDVLRAQRELQSPRSQRENTTEAQSRIDATREQHQRNMKDMRALKQDVVDARQYECSPRVSKDSKHIAEAVGLWKMNADRFEKAKERFASHRAASPSAKPPSTSHFNFDGANNGQRMDKISDLMMKNADLEEEMRQIRLLSPKMSSHDEAWSPSSTKSASSNVNDIQHALYTPSSTRLATPKTYSYNSPQQLAVTTSMSPSSLSEETQMKSRITGLIDEVKQFLSENEQVQERLSDDILALRT